jgi:chromosomal replication initiation ATPase DnaA
MTWQERRKKEIEKIIERTVKKFSITKEDLSSKSRKKELVYSRRFLLNILFELFEEDKMRQEEIAEIIKKDRTSFIYHRSQHLLHYNRYKEYKKDFDSFKIDCETSIKDTVL